MDKKDLLPAIEAILFTMGKAVKLDTLAKAVELDVVTTKELVLQLAQQYTKRNSGITIIELEGSYQMCTRQEMYEYLIKVVSQPKKQVLTDVLLETLSIVAYKQPITRSEIEKIRGVSCAHVVSKLIEYKLITELGRLDAPGRPMLLGTTEDFLRSFGISSIEYLPQMNPVKWEEFKQEAEQEVENKQ